MRLILSIFLFAALIFGNQKITDPETGEEISLYNKSWTVIIGVNKYEQSCINDIILSDSSGNEADISYFLDQNNNCITIE